MTKKQLKAQKQVVIIMGPPGSGKGTQAELLSEKLDLYYLETSKLLEAAFNSGEDRIISVKGKRYSMKNERKFWLTGKLNSDPFVNYLAAEKIKKIIEGNNGLILAGSPRTPDQAKELMPFLAKLYGKENIKTVLLEISTEETIFRNSHRKICELMRHPVLYSKETIKLSNCPLDGSKLIKRKGLDTPETIKVRLKTYNQETLPVVGYLKKTGFSVKRVNGSPAPAIVFKNILKSLDKD